MIDKDYVCLHSAENVYLYIRAVPSQLESRVDSHGGIFLIP
jgi:hypothetical protein